MEKCLSKIGRMSDGCPDQMRASDGGNAAFAPGEGANAGGGGVIEGLTGMGMGLDYLCQRL